MEDRHDRRRTRQQPGDTARSEEPDWRASFFLLWQAVSMPAEKNDSLLLLAF
jgi:hypothetical protein